MSRSKMRSIVAVNFSMKFILLLIICFLPVALHAQTPQCDTQCVQRLQSALEFQTQRADEAVSQRNAWKEQAATWQKLFLDERQRSTLLTGANADRRSAESFQADAIMQLREQHRLDETAIRDLSREVKACEKAKFKSTVIAFGVGAVTGAVVRPRFSF